MNDEIKEILLEITSIQLRYTKPLLLKDGRDEIIDDYEKLVFKMIKFMTNLQEENEELKEQKKKAIEWIKEHIETYKKMK